MAPFWKEFPFDFQRPCIQIPITVLGIVGILLNFLLILIILKKRTHLVGIYKFLLFVYTFIGFLATTLLTIAIPVLIPSPNGAYMVNTVIRLPHWGHRLLVCIYDGSLMGWIIILTYSFLFRCLAVRNRERYVFNRFGILVLTIIAVFACLLSPSAIWLAGPAIFPDDTADLLEDLSGHNISDLTVVGSQFFTYSGAIDDGMVLCLSTLGTMLPCVLTMVVCSTVYFFWYRRKLAQRNITRISLQKHHRMFTLLLFQSITPLTFTFIPPATVFLLALFSVKLPHDFNYLASSLLFLAQLLDPIWIFWFIRDYRETLFSCFSTKEASNEPAIIRHHSLSRSSSK